MTIRTTIIASTAFLLLAGCNRGAENGAGNSATTAQVGETGVAGPTPTLAGKSTSQRFADAAAASDVFEIETSKLALANGSAAPIKAYARKMIDAHTDSTAKLKAAASAMASPIAPNPALTPNQQQKLDRLKTLNGAEFDRAYLSEQRAGHQQTLDTLRDYSTAGDVTELKAFASAQIPVVTAHLNMANALKV